MKIGIVCYPTVGGSGILATELGHELANRGHEIHFITYEIPFRLRLEDKNIFFHQVEINQYDLFKYPDYALTLAVKIAAVSKEYSLDIIHAHYAIPHATSAYLAKQMLGCGRPYVVTTLHGTDITLVGKDPAYFPIVKYSIENSCGITGVSEYICQQTKEIFGITKSIQQIYNFFIPRPELIGKKTMRNKFVEEDEKLLIHSSNYRSIKRPMDVLRIFVEVKKTVKCRLLLLGTGGELEDVRKMAYSLKLEKDVFFLGKSGCIDFYVASADLFILPSEQESFGLAALEAMAYGVPIICTTAGGLPELVEQGRTGFLSPVGDVASMAKDTIKILTDPKMHESMSEQCIRSAREKFCVEKIVPQYEEYYKHILGK